MYIIFRRSGGTVCRRCGKELSRRDYRKTHERKCNGAKERAADKTTCSKCGKKFTVYNNRIRHEKSCAYEKSHSGISESYSCPICGSEFTSVRDLANHQEETRHVRAGCSSSDLDVPSNRPLENKRKKKPVVRTEGNKVQKKDGVKCRMCGRVCSSHADLYDHRTRVHYQSGGNASLFQSVPWSDGQEPWRNKDGSINEAFKRSCEQHRHLILKKKKSESSGAVIDYNFPVNNDISPDYISEQVENIYVDNQHAFRINLHFGLILQNTETGEYRYFVPYYNENLFF